MKFSELKLLEVGHTIHLVGAIYADEVRDLDILCFFPGEAAEHASEILEMDTDEWNKFLRQSDVMETEVLARAKDGKVCKAILRKSARQIGQDVSWQVFKRDGYACRYCGRDDVPLTVDHLVLWEEGGPSTPENLVAACRKCNKKRGNTPYGGWLCHPYYRRVSENLSTAKRHDNLDLVAKLDAIPRVLHKRTKR